MSFAFVHSSFTRGERFRACTIEEGSTRGQHLLGVSHGFLRPQQENETAAYFLPTLYIYHHNIIKEMWPVLILQLTGHISTYFHKISFCPVVELSVTCIQRRPLFKDQIVAM
jgi:hypothetical protein